VQPHGTLQDVRRCHLKDGSGWGKLTCWTPEATAQVTITKSIRIISDHIEAGVLVSGTNGIIVNVASTDNVLLDGLDIEGLGTGLNGVQIIGGGSVVIRRTSINHFTGNGVNLTGANNAKVFVQNTVISNNGGGGECTRCGWGHK